MRSFLKHAFIFILVISALLAGYCWLYWAYFPAPRLTTNISLNEQLLHVKRIHEGKVPHNPDGKVNYLAVGSSMSLNNMHSRTVVAYFGDSNYVNTGSWSTRIHQTAKLTAMFINTLRPHTVILTSNMEDWMNFKDRYDADTIKFRNYIHDWTDVEAYMRTLRPSYYLREMERNKVRMTDPTYFDFLGFDKWGATSIDVPPERVEADRYVNTIPRPDQVEHELYPHLEWLAAHLAERNIRFIYIQSPYRDVDMSDELSTILAEHEARVQRILAAHGHTFITSTDRSWPKELFVDPSHFKEKGARMFTEYVLAKLSAMNAGDRAGLANGHAGSPKVMEAEPTSPERR